MFQVLWLDFRLGPFEGFGGLVPGSDEGCNGPDKLANTGKVSSLESAAT
jgi:hypothetical protein